MKKFQTLGGSLALATVAALLTVATLLTPTETVEAHNADADGDGFNHHADCNDGDASVHPGAPELDDGADNNCNGQVDEGLDGDGDGFTPVFGGDCNDGDASVHPGALELDDGVDNNCNGQVDEGLEPCGPQQAVACPGGYGEGAVAGAASGGPVVPTGDSGLLAGGDSSSNWPAALLALLVLGGLTGACLRFRKASS